MARYYGQAEEKGRAEGALNVFYPALNRLAAQCALAASGGTTAAPDPAWVAAIRQSLVDKSRDDPDFWSVAGLTELRLFEAVAAGKLAAALGTIGAELEDLSARVRGASHWGSVLDTLRFVLHGTLAHGSADESTAAQKLITQVEAYAMS
jgi:hypothetical protein